MSSSEPAADKSGPRFIRWLALTNILSFGSTEPIELRSLNVLVGANGSGKTNLVEALAVLAACPHDLAAPFRRSGGLATWFKWDSKDRSFLIRASAHHPGTSVVLTHSLTIKESHRRPTVAQEYLVSESLKDIGKSEGIVYSHTSNVRYVSENLQDDVSVEDGTDNDQSALALYKSTKRYPELSHLQRVYDAIRFYRTWTFGPDSLLRRTQAADLPNEWLAEDYGNLFLILNRLEFESEAKAEFLERLRNFLPDVTDYKLQIVGGTILMFLMEGRNPVPATRLSDGTLRWLCLLAILVAPSPPGVIVLEGPELGLHPDMINTLADMLKKASTRHQLVVTTHSDILIDALSDVPEAVMVVEKEESGTVVRRLDAEELRPWLEKYRLGRLWMKGQIGGTRW